MTDPLDTHRLLTASMTVVALLGWGTYAYSTDSSATRDQARLEAIARITTERDALHSEHQRLVSGQLKLVSEQQRFQGELALANTQLAAAREEIALLPQRNVAKKTWARSSLALRHVKRSTRVRRRRKKYARRLRSDDPPRGRQRTREGSGPTAARRCRT